MAALDALADWPVPSAAAAVIGPSGVLATPRRHRAGVRAASVTKPLVARAVQVAVEEGVVDLDTAAGPPGSTVRHLLAHASGLAMHSGQVLAKPGTRRMYSNYGFTVLAETVQRESGIEFGRYLSRGGVRTAGHGGHPAGRRRARRPGSGRPRRLRIWRHSPVTCCARRPSRRRCTPTRRPCNFPVWTACCPDTACSGPTIGGWVSRSGMRNRRIGRAPATRPRTYGHFGQSGTFIWADPEAELALVVLTDRDFGDWALDVWPALSDAVISESAN